MNRILCFSLPLLADAGDMFVSDDRMYETEGEAEGFRYLKEAADYTDRIS